MKLIYGTEYKANLTEKTSFVTGLGVGKSISEGGTLQAKNESHSFYFGLTYDFNPNKDRVTQIALILL